MVDGRMYPIFPCADLDAAIEFYEAIGFTRTYRQVRPNPHAVVELGELGIHLGCFEGFDPENSYASVIVAVRDPDTLYRQFAEGLRRRYGRLPVSGIPRVTRPRKRYGTVDGFSLVDVGGNWIRVSRMGDTEEATEHAEGGLPRIVEVAGRMADSQGDVAGGLKTLESGLRRYPEAEPINRARALLFRAELAIRLDDTDLARSTLQELNALALPYDERAQLQDELDHVTGLIDSSANSDEVG
jgi:catechol 2,3-dioxygenase-like lactoylglutathione lyase family enzyme